MLTFRRAEMCDIPDVMRAVHEAQAFMKGLGIDQWQDGYPERSTLEKDVEIGQLYVCFDEEAGCVAAFAALSLLPEPIYDAIDGAWRTEGPYLTIHRMALDDAHRGSGIADQMIDLAVRIAREHVCASLRVDTHRGNLAMRRFLEKRGFVYCGTVIYEVMKGDKLRVAYDKSL